MESFSSEGVAAQGVSARDALELIEQAETETYLPVGHLPSAETSRTAHLMVLLVGIGAMTLVLWLMSRNAVWALPAGVAAAFTFVGVMHRWENSGRNAERRKVALKATFPLHVWREMLVQNWPLAVGVGLPAGVIAPIMVATPRPIWHYAVLAAVWLPLGVALTVAMTRFRDRQDS